MRAANEREWKDGPEAKEGAQAKFDGGNGIGAKSNTARHGRLLRLWYAAPAAKWEEALPIGNGRLGAMVYGSTGLETIRLNEDSLWYGGPGRAANPDARPYLDEIRGLLRDGRQAEAEHLARMAMTASPKYEQPYQPLGDLMLKPLKDAAPVEDYERELDLERAVVNVTYHADGVNCRLAVFRQRTGRGAGHPSDGRPPRRVDLCRQFDAPSLRRRLPGPCRRHGRHERGMRRGRRSFQRRVPRRP